MRHLPVREERRRAGFDSLDYPPAHLAALDLDFEILEPPVLQEHARQVAAGLQSAVGGPADGDGEGTGAAH